MKAMILLAACMAVAISGCNESMSVAHGVALAQSVASAACYQVPIVNGVAAVSAMNGPMQCVDPDPPWGYCVSIQVDSSGWPEGSRLDLRLTGSDSGAFYLDNGFRTIPWEQSLEDALWGIGGTAWYQFRVINGKMEQISPRAMLPPP